MIAHADTKYSALRQKPLCEGEAGSETGRVWSAVLAGEFSQSAFTGGKGQRVEGRAHSYFPKGLFLPTEWGGDKAGCCRSPPGERETYSVP